MQHFSHHTKHSSAFYTQNILSALFAPSHRFQERLHSSSQSHQTPETKNSKLTSAKMRAAYLLLPLSIRLFYSGSLFKGRFVSGAQTERKTCFRFHSAPFMLNSFLRFCLLSHAASLQLSISAGYLALLSSSSQIIHCSIFFSCSAAPLLTSVPGG